MYLCAIGIFLTIIFVVKIPESFRLLLLKGEVNESEKLLTSLLTEQNKPAILI